MNDIHLAPHQPKFPDKSWIALAIKLSQLRRIVLKRIGERRDGAQTERARLTQIYSDWDTLVDIARAELGEG